MNIQPTSERAADYLWFGKRCLDIARQSGLPGVRAIKDGSFVVVCKYTLHKATLIVLGGNFLSHPRSGPLRKIRYTSGAVDEQFLTSVYHGGYSSRGNEQMTNELDQKWSYPLIDDDQATFVIDSEDITAEWTQGENYGNIWWIGEDGTTLSWRGPPNRHFPLPSSTDIPGLTQYEGVYSSSTNLATAHTPFSNRIYKDGVVLAKANAIESDDDMLSLIVGACYYKETLICMTVSNFGNAFWFQIWKQVKGKFVEIGDMIKTSRASTPCFINQTGNQFVFRGAKYTIHEQLRGYSKQEEIPAASPGRKTVTGDGGYGSTYRYSGSTAHLWPGMASGSAMEHSAITSNAEFSGERWGHVGDTTAEKTTIPVYRGDPATVVMVSASISNGKWVFGVVANGAYCSVSWDGADADGTTAIKDVECGKGFTVTATLQPQGVSGSYTQPDVEMGEAYITGPDVYTPNAYSGHGFYGPTTVSEPDPNDCGMGTVSINDLCGNSASMSVRMQTGVWCATETGCIDINGNQTQAGYPGCLQNGNWDNTGSGTIYYIISGCAKESSYAALCTSSPKYYSLPINDAPCVTDLGQPGKICSFKMGYLTRTWKCSCS